jgi:hypothetical protein
MSESRRLSLRTEPLHPRATCVVLHVLDVDTPGAPPVLTLLTTAPDRDGLEAIAILEGRHQNPQDMPTA